MTLLESSEVQQVFCINSALTHIFDFYPILFNSPAQYYSSQDFLSPCFLMDIIPPHRMPQLSTQMQHIFRNLDKMRVFFEAILYLLRSWDTCHFIHLTGIQPFFFFFWCIAMMQSRHPVHGYKMNVRQQIQGYTLQEIWTRAAFVDNISAQHLGEEPALLRTWPCMGPWPHPFWYLCMSLEKLSHLLSRRYR